MNFALLGFPPEASSYASHIDEIFLLVISLCIVVLVGVLGLLTFFCVRYREGSNVPRPHQHANSTPIEITWMVIPTLIFIYLFVLAGREYARMYSPPATGMNVYIVGKQWMWKVEHENGQRELDTLHVPVDQDVIVALTSEDVIHSFFVPAFRVKHDAVPGSYAKFWFRAREPGHFHIFCAQYCGLDHSQMIGEVIAMRPRDYAAWVEAGKPEHDMVSAGETLFHQVGCSGCHEATSTIHAPLLNGLYGKPVALQTGQVVVADRQYLRDSILLPNKDIAAGFAPVMPTYQGRLTEEQVNELLAYLMSLADKPYDNAHPTTP